MRVLIVEDDNKTACAIASGLESGGFSATTAHSGVEGFFLLDAEVFDLVLLDWMLPGRDGRNGVTHSMVRSCPKVNRADSDEMQGFFSSVFSVPPCSGFFWL